MAAFLPFSPAMTGGTVGLTAAIVLASGSITAGSATIGNGPYINALLVSNVSSVAAFARVATVAGLTASVVDVPIMPASSRILAAPDSGAIYVYAVNAATLGANSTVYFTPGKSGDG